MKINKLSLYVFGVGLVFFGLVSCSKKFLDREPYDSLPSSTAISSPDDMQVALNGMYADLRDVDLYGRTLPVFGDLYADNTFVSPNNSGRYLAFFSYSVTVANADMGGTWEAAYEVILRANNIINADVTGDEVANMKGQAKAIRALMYFDLVRVFSHPYSVAPDDPGVPVVLKFDPTNYPQRNSVKEVYAQIVDDLNDAVSSMDPINENSSYMGKWAAEGLLAKVYLYMQDWENARDKAKDVIDNSGFKPVSGEDLLDYWKNDQPTVKSETLFEVSFTSKENLSTDGLNYIYMQSGYGDILCTDNLYEDYSNSDFRKELVLQTTKDNKVGGTPVLAVNKYFYAQTADKKDNTKVLRMAEVKLILAEAYARLQDDPDALKQLNELAEDRDPSFAGYTSSGDNLINDIINERRKELAFEGDRYFDYKRLNWKVERDNQYPDGARELDVSDYRRIMPIPQGEVDANKNIEQNPDYK